MDKETKNQYMRCYLIDPEVQSILNRLQKAIKSGEYGEIQILEIEFNRHVNSHHPKIKDDIDFTYYVKMYQKENNE